MTGTYYETSEQVLIFLKAYVKLISVALVLNKFLDFEKLLIRRRNNIRYVNLKARHLLNLAHFIMVCFHNLRKQLKSMMVAQQFKKISYSGREKHFYHVVFLLKVNCRIFKIN